MTTLVERREPPTRAASLRTLAGVEALRYARHPLFLVGVAMFFAMAVLSWGDLDAATVSDVTIEPAFFLGVLGVFVGYQLTVSMARSGEAVEAAPADGVLRTAALCIACLVPGAVAFAGFAWLYGWQVPESPVIGSADRAAILFQGVLCAVGGPLVGVMVGRWAPFPGAALVAAVVLVGWTVLGGVTALMSPSRVSSLVHLNAPFTYWLNGNRDGHPWVAGGSPPWYVVYVTLLCVLAATAALLHEARGKQRARLVRVLVILAVLAVVCLGLAAAPDPTRVTL